IRGFYNLVTTQFASSRGGITGPVGTPVSVLGVQPILTRTEMITLGFANAAREFEITFRPVEHQTSYALTIGPDVRDLDGPPMDQSHDGINGKPGDSYSAWFDLVAQAVVPVPSSPPAAGSPPRVGGTISPDIIRPLIVGPAASPIVLAPLAGGASALVPSPAGKSSGSTTTPPAAKLTLPPRPRAIPTGPPPSLSKVTTVPTTAPAVSLSLPQQNKPVSKVVSPLVRPLGTL